MKRTTTAEHTRRTPVPSPPPRRPGAQAAAAVVVVALSIAGCTAPQQSATQTPAPSSGRPASLPPESQPSIQAAESVPAQVPGPTIPVRPATPTAQAPADPAPRFLTVEGTTINMAIVEVGVGPNGAMEIPEPFNEAGWYRFGPAPGAAAGAAVVAAHVDTTSDAAPFSQLKSLAPGTLVTVRREGAEALNFRVTGVELMAKEAFDGSSIFRRDGLPQLKLVTCGGRWLDEQQNYGDNVIVTAVPA